WGLKRPIKIYNAFRKDSHNANYSWFNLIHKDHLMKKGCNAATLFEIMLNELIFHRSRAGTWFIKVQFILGNIPVIEVPVVHKAGNRRWVCLCRNKQVAGDQYNCICPTTSLRCGLCYTPSSCIIKSSAP